MFGKPAVKHASWNPAVRQVFRANILRVERVHYIRQGHSRLILAVEHTLACHLLCRDAGMQKTNLRLAVSLEVAVEQVASERVIGSPATFFVLLGTAAEFGALLCDLRKVYPFALAPLLFDELSNGSFTPSNFLVATCPLLTGAFRPFSIFSSKPRGRPNLLATFGLDRMRLVALNGNCRRAATLFVRPLFGRGALPQAASGSQGAPLFRTFRRQFSLFDCHDALCWRALHEGCGGKQQCRGLRVRPVGLAAARRC
jgi:hypothetical protein